MISITLPSRSFLRVPAADPVLVLAVATLLSLSMVMVFSAAIGTHGGVQGGFAILVKHSFIADVKFCSRCEVL